MPQSISQLQRELHAARARYNKLLDKFKQAGPKREKKLRRRRRRSLRKTVMIINTGVLLFSLGNAVERADYERLLAWNNESSTDTGATSLSIDVTDGGRLSPASNDTVSVGSECIITDGQCLSPRPQCAGTACCCGVDVVGKQAIAQAKAASEGLVADGPGDETDTDVQETVQVLTAVLEQERMMLAELEKQTRDRETGEGNYDEEESDSEDNYDGYDASESSASSTIDCDFLMAIIDTEDFAPTLLQTGAIDEQQVEKIKALGSTEQRTKYLLDHVILKQRK